MSNFNLELVVHVGHSVNGKSNQPCLFDLLATLVAEAPLSKDHKQIFVLEPLGYFIDGLAVSIPESVTRCEENRDS